MKKGDEENAFEYGWVVKTHVCVCLCGCDAMKRSKVSNELTRKENTTSVFLSGAFSTHYNQNLLMVLKIHFHSFHLYVLLCAQCNIHIYLFISIFFRFDTLTFGPNIKRIASSTVCIFFILMPFLFQPKKNFVNVSVAAHHKPVFVC